jgi:ABC-type glutathione transport system ATPase component
VAEEAAFAVALHKALRAAGAAGRMSGGLGAAAAAEGAAATETAAWAAAQRGGWGEATILLDGLHKVYPPPLLASGGAQSKHAVRGISLAVPRGETFGFLGINGQENKKT